MGLFDCCTLSADSFAPSHQQWDDHPSRLIYEPLQDLGTGAFSQVVLARHRSTGALAALKVVFLDNPELDADTEHMLKQEGDLLLHHLSHPNLVTCTDVITSPRAHVLVLEFLRGCSILDGLYKLSDKYTERDAWCVFVQLASVVAYLHRQGVLHRDIKPENVVFVDDIHSFPSSCLDMDMNVSHKQVFTNGNATTREHATVPAPPRVKLVDLGMAWASKPLIVESARGQKPSIQYGVLGSAGFIAPEVILGHPHTPAMDVFSMGVMLFILLVGRKPFNLEDSEKLRYATMGLSNAPGIKDPRWLDLSPDAKHLLMGMLTFDPGRRLTAEQVLGHEWMVTRGGRVLRLLGQDVALGAATVAEMRRLRFLCNGVVALRRVAETTANEKSRISVAKREKEKKKQGGGGGGGGGVSSPSSCREAQEYVDGLKRMQKREASVRGGGRGSVRGVARSITAASYKHIHDSTGGGSVHKSTLAASIVYRQQQQQQLNNGGGTGGMRRSGTALLLSEVLAPDPESSVHSSVNGSVRHRYNTTTALAQQGQESLRRCRNQSTSSLQLLGASLLQYIDVSVHRGQQHFSKNESTTTKTGTTTTNDAFTSKKDVYELSSKRGEGEATLYAHDSVDKDLAMHFIDQPRIIQVPRGNSLDLSSGGGGGGGGSGSGKARRQLNGVMGERRRVHSLKALY